MNTAMTPPNAQKKPRDEAIDALKGIGILLVLTAHSLGGGLGRFAYSFHMPLFFIVSGLFIAGCPAKGRAEFGSWWLDRMRKDFRRLLWPAILTLAVIFLVSCLAFALDGTYLKSPKALVWDPDPHRMFAKLHRIGNFWFLFALFLGRQYFFLLRQAVRNRLLPVLCVALGWLAVPLGKWAPAPPVIFVAFSALPFIWAGWFVQGRGGVGRGIPRWFFLAVPLWAAYAVLGRMDMAKMLYSWGYVPDAVAACGGTLFFYHVSRLVCAKARPLGSFLAFCGRCSLVLICAPGIETYCFPMQTVVPDVPCRQAVVLAGKLLWNVVAVCVCLRIPFLRNLFGLPARAR